jgi:transposase
MDWLLARQDSIEATLAGRHLSEGGMAMFDLSSSWMEGSHCPLAARGYSRDRKKGKLQIEYGLLTDPDGRPVAIRVFAGNTADPTAFTEAVEVVRGKFGLGQLTLVGDRGMITSARIEALRELGGLSWITCLRAPTIAKLADQNGPLQMSLFDQ